MRLCANISMLFTELPLAERVGAAAQAGFDGVEVQFPTISDVAPLRDASEAAGIPIVLINVPRGLGDAVGLAALPGQEQAFRTAVEICGSQCLTLGVHKVNVLAGRPPPEAARDACRKVLARNLQMAADLLGGLGVRVMVEPVNPHDVPGFFLDGLTPALDLLSDLDHPNLALQFDLYHMSINEPDLVAAIRRAGARIGHVQFADTPGRHEPGSGSVDFAAALGALEEIGYRGEISAEYHPRGRTQEGLGWMAAFREMMA
ncbi:hydroxypyruvate isomerase family protein [Sulfitobacter aestuarii]|uniref:Hydroxypyruvate isomerase family protein n=1 Tax=Sulfitobacter aestuarii TaxID=2161676 RepID=A0ABW5U0M1_9RHOB